MLRPLSAQLPLGPEHRVKYQSELWSLKYDGVENERRVAEDSLSLGADRAQCSVLNTQ